MILDRFSMGGVYAYTISKASDEFKKAYPKAWIVCSISRNEVLNVESLSELPYDFSEISYLFINRKPTLKDKVRRFTPFGYYNPDSSDSILRAKPFDGHNFFIGDKLDSDIIIKIVPRVTVIDPRLMNSIVIRDKCSYMREVDFKKSLPVILKETYNDTYLKSVNNTEKWLLAFLHELPYGLYNEPFTFPEHIDDVLFTQKLNLNINNFTIGYCMRTDIKTEIDMVHDLEKQLTPLNKRVTIYENYNGLAKRVMEEAKANKMKYNYEPGISVSLKIDDLFKLKMKFKITDFMK